MNQLYISHKENHKTKFLIKDDKDEDENISFFYSKSENEENTENILEGFLNEIKFYQCESSIKNLEYYSDYFTLSEKILNDEDLVGGEIQVKDNHTKETVMVKEAEIDDYLDMNCR